MFKGNFKQLNRSTRYSLSVYDSGQTYSTTYFLFMIFEYLTEIINEMTFCYRILEELGNKNLLLRWISITSLFLDVEGLQ